MVKTKQSKRHLRSRCLINVQLSNIREKAKKIVYKVHSFKMLWHIWWSYKWRKKWLQLRLDQFLLLFVCIRSSNKWMKIYISITTWSSIINLSDCAIHIDRTIDHWWNHSLLWCESGEEEEGEEASGGIQDIIGNYHNLDELKCWQVVRDLDVHYILSYIYLYI